VVERAL
jgi:phosphoglycerate dehydrogenase-like enzyme